MAQTVQINEDTFPTFKVYWVELLLRENGHELTVWVSGDAARWPAELSNFLGERQLPPSELGWRIGWSAENQQKFADYLDASLLTPKLVDLIYLHADIVIEPVIQVPPGSGKITALSRVEDYTKHVDEAVSRSAIKGRLNTRNECPAEPLVSGTCKDWVLDESLQVDDHAVNDGWHSEMAPYRSRVPPWHLRKWQVQGRAHNVHHADPSQGARFVQQKCRLRRAGSKLVEWVRFEDILLDPELAPLVSHTDRPGPGKPGYGVLTYSRLPVVPRQFRAPDK